VRRVLVVGATSAIAMAVLRRLAGRGDYLLLAGRREERLKILSRDLEVRGAAGVEVLIYDALGTPDPEGFVEAAWGDGLDIVLLAHGSLPDQGSTRDDPESTARELRVNALSHMELLAALAPRFEVRGRGTIAVIASVAGDRGRRSNYVYGAAKAALSTYTQGLRNRLDRSGVAVVTIKPGFVDTPMTRDFDKGILWVGPERVAADIERALEGGGRIVYTPGFWRWLMWAVRSIPEWAFKRLPG